MTEPPSASNNPLDGFCGFPRSASERQTANVIQLMIPGNGKEVPDYLPQSLPLMIVRSDFFLWTRTRKVPAPPDLLRLAEIAIALGMPSRWREPGHEN
ncbi:MAG: hypothetical protein ABSC06_05265 [Rhodopila sp.]|jgi:hypothetical protein